MLITMNTLHFLTLLFAISLACITSSAAADKLSEQRQTAREQMAKGNWKDALGLLETTLAQAENQGENLADDLNQAVLCQRQLNQLENFDALVEAAVSAHGMDWRLLQMAGALYADTQHHGSILSGKFVRGKYDGSQHVTSARRDRARALQLLQQALLALPADAPAGGRSDLFREFASIVGGVEGWEMQALTDLTVLPDYDDGHEHGQFFYRDRYNLRHQGFNSRGAPVDEKGEPVYHHVPASWEAAASDGESWRWLLAELAKGGGDLASEAELKFAQFYQAQFGEHTLAEWGWRPREDDEDAKREDSILTLHTLKENETCARLATGPKRFTLPDEFNYLAVYQRLAEKTPGSPFCIRGAHELAAIFKNRHQLTRVVEVLRKAIDFHKNNVKELQDELASITGKLGRLENIAMQPAGQGAKIGYVFRNGTKVSFRARRVDFQRLLKETKAYLKSDPQTLDWQRAQPQNIGYQIFQEGQEKYVGEEVAKWDLELKPREGHLDRRVEIATPLQAGGAYFLEAQMADGNLSRVLLWVTDSVIVRQMNGTEVQYFVVDALTGKPVGKANLDIFGYQQQYIDAKKQSGKRQSHIETKNFAEFTDEQGQFFADKKSMPDGYQWMITATTPEGRFAHLGYNSVWYGQENQGPERTKIYTLTDRPIYRPAQKVKFKTWARVAAFDEPEDKHFFAGKTFGVTIWNPQNEKVFEKQLKADDEGGFDDELTLAEDAGLGVYRISIDHQNGHGDAQFRVEEYKKPEFEVIVDAPKDPVTLGEKFTAKITAKYYFGAPVQNAKVKTTVRRSGYAAQWYPVRPWDWYYGPGYWWFCYDCDWMPGWTEWGCKAPRWWWMPWSADPPELVLEQEGMIGGDGLLQIDLDTALAKELHPDEDHQYDITVEVTDESRRTIVGSGKVLVARQPFKVYAWTDRGHYNVGDTVNVGISARTLDQKGIVGTGTLRLLKLSYDEKGVVTETEISQQELKTDEEGAGSAKLSATVAGQYRLSVKVKDQQGREREGGYVFVVRGPGQDGRDFRFNQLELVVDKPEYAPGDEVKLMISTERPESTVYLFVRHGKNGAVRPKILSMKGKIASETIKVELGDMPNFFIEAFTVADGKVHSVQREIIVPPAKRVLNMEVLADAAKYQPRGTAKVKVKLTDLDGKPFVGTTVLSVYDKALDAIAGRSNIPNMREFFWKWRRSNHLRLETSLVMFSNVDTRPAMAVLGVFGHEFGELMGKSKTRGEFPGRSAGFGGGGRALFATGKNGAPGSGLRHEGMAELKKNVADNDAAAAPPDQGAAPVMVRSNFADSVFWAASLKTNAEGIAEVEVPLPDNLTTWKIRGWGMGSGTRVGQAEAEIITSKDLILRQQAPRFFVEKDEVVLSANVHHFLPDKQDVTVTLELEGTCLKLLPGHAAEQKITLDANGEQRVDWRVEAVHEGTAIVRMKAVTAKDSDAMQMSYPVMVHGMLKTESWSAAVKPDKPGTTLEFTIPKERRPEQTTLEVRYSPSLATAMVDALPYLIDYPYGCTEQTLNRFVPVVVTHKVLLDMGLDLKAIKEKRVNLNAQELGIPKDRAEQWKKYQGISNGIFDDAEYRALVRHSLAKLANMQNRDGGWGWFAGEREESYPHTTATVIHGLQTAREAGLALLPDVLERGLAWLKAYEQGEVQKIKSNNPTLKSKADNTDAFVHMVLTDGEIVNEEMGDFLFRDKNLLSVYGKCLIGLAYDKQQRQAQRDEVLENIEQFLIKDPENQTAHLDLRNGGYWWWWYGSEFEAHAWYLKLLSRVKPSSDEASGLAKFLLNNRKNSTWWTSTRDTALCVEAMADYIRATGENLPDMTVEILLDGEVKKNVSITKDNLFSFDSTLLLQGEGLTDGKHTLELRRKGKGAVYLNAYVTNFTLEDRITAAGLEVKVDRKYYKLTERKDAKVLVSGGRGQALNQKVLKYDRTEIKDGEALKSGDLVEVELTLDSKNDYEYLLFEDMKAAGFEPVDIRSGYSWEGLPAYREFRDERVAFFVRALPMGKHNLSYRLRAEIPGSFSALPAKATAMYAPELRGNSDEMKVRVVD